MITKKYLKNHPNHVFVFGDNTVRKGYKGGALLRSEPNSYGFITKKYPNNQSTSFYRPEEYEKIFWQELKLLEQLIEREAEKTFLISQLGGGLANRYHIYEKVIAPNLKEELKQYPNVEFLF